MTHESESERLDRELMELLQELRVAQTGVQFLFGFLLSLPFTQRFSTLTSAQRGVYLGTLIAAAVASALLIAPSAYHRLLFHQHDKRHLLAASNRLAVGGLVALAVAICAAVFLIVDFLFHATTVAIVVAPVALLFAATWFVLPLLRRGES